MVNLTNGELILNIKTTETKVDRPTVCQYPTTKKRNKNAPFARDVEQNTIDNIMIRAIRGSDRWDIMEKEGKSEKEIRASFYKKINMKYLNK